MRYLLAVALLGLLTALGVSCLVWAGDIREGYRVAARARRGAL